MKALTLFLSFGLLLGLVPPAWGQPKGEATAKAAGHEPSVKPRAVAPDVPVDDFDRGTPRRAVAGFLKATRADDYKQAAEYLDLGGLPDDVAKTLGPQLARHLKIVLDQKLPIDTDTLSDSPAGHLQDALPPDVEEVGAIETPEGAVHIRLQQIPRDDGVKIWKISAASLSAVPDLYNRYGYGLLGELLPRVLVETEFLDTQLRQWLALLILIALGYGLGVLVTSLGLRLLRRRRSELARVLNRFVVEPVRLLVLVLFISLARRPMEFSLTADRILTGLEEILLIFAITWVILRALESCEAIARSEALRRKKDILLPLLPVLRKSAKILIAALAIVAVLHSFGVNVITVLAGLGIGGIAVALAMQRTLGDFIGGITLYADQPVLVGEFCRFGGHVGTVEEVGLRSTRVRTLDRTIVTVPNAEFSNLQIENFTRRDRIWYHPTIRLSYETTPDQIRYILVEVHRMLYAHPKVDSTSARIRFAGFGSSSLDLDVFSYVTVTDYGEYLEIAEDLNLRIMDIVGAAGSSFALPSRTTYVEKWRGFDSDRARAAEEQVKEWRERHELWLPRFPREKIIEIDSTLEYPAQGSNTGVRPR
ncbi:MAG TPA: mechanosensitive ion channel family protein [Candidatus Binatia bacterium]|nr:mechanosensitive ion channel family protein [Candidatus Binatia bacterium]